MVQWLDSMLYDVLLIKAEIGYNGNQKSNMLDSAGVSHSKIHITGLLRVSRTSRILVLRILSCNGDNVRGNRLLHQGHQTVV